jgi:hypothetical protein
LFCSCEIPLDWDASDCVLGVLGKLSMRRGAWTRFHIFEKLSTKRGAWVCFHDIWPCGAKVLEF